MEIWNIVLENGLVLLIVLIGIIEAIKVLLIKKEALSPQDRAIFAVSLAVGLIAGFVYQFAKFGAPATFMGWFSMAAFGVGLGVVMPWVYKAAGNIMEKVGKALAQSVASSANVKIDDTDYPVMPPAEHTEP